MKYLIAALLSSAKLCLPCARLAVTTKEKSSWPCAPFGGSPESSPQLVGQKEHGRSGGSCFIKWINYLTSFLNKSPFCTLGYFSVPLHRHHQRPQVQLVRTFWDKPCSLLLFLLLGFFVFPPPPPPVVSEIIHHHERSYLWCDRCILCCLAEMNAYTLCDAGLPNATGSFTACVSSSDLHWGNREPGLGFRLRLMPWHFHCEVKWNCLNPTLS